MLIDHQNAKESRCNPKEKTLAAELGVARATIERALADLRRIGLLQSVRSQRFNRYEIVNPARWPIILMTQNESSETVPDDSKRVNKMTQNESSGASASLLLNVLIERGADRAAAAVETSTLSTRAPALVYGGAAAAAAHARVKINSVSELCRELLSRHPHPQQPHKAEEELKKILSSAAPELIRERHAAWCAYWAANPGKFIPHLWRWLADGDWETSPPTERKPPAKSRKGQLIDDLFASLDAKKRGA
jgi:hypothetical protein